MQSFLLIFPHSSQTAVTLLSVKAIARKVQMMMMMTRNHNASDDDEGDTDDEGAQYRERCYLNTAHASNTGSLP